MLAATADNTLLITILVILLIICAIVWLVRR